MDLDGPFDHLPGLIFLSIVRGTENLSTTHADSAEKKNTSPQSTKYQTKRKRRKTFAESFKDQTPVALTDKLHELTTL